MAPKYITHALTALAVCFSTNLAMAYEHLADRPAQPASKASVHGNKTQIKQSPTNVKTGPKVKLVDINTANKSALLKLPGITDADADKIISNRPYGSKAWLVTNKIVDTTTYAGIRTLIEAKQALKATPKNVAVSGKTVKQ